MPTQVIETEILFRRLKIFSDFAAQRGAPARVSAVCFPRSRCFDLILLFVICNFKQKLGAGSCAWQLRGHNVHVDCDCTADQQHSAAQVILR
jgi:hypothetical protein